MKKIFISIFLLLLVLKCFGRNPCDEVMEIRILYSNTFTVMGMRNPCETFEKKFVDPDNIPTIILKDPEDIGIVMGGISEFKSYSEDAVDGPILKIFIDYGCRIDVLCVNYTYYPLVRFNGKFMQGTENYAMDIIKMMKKYDPTIVTYEDLLKELNQ